MTPTTTTTRPRLRDHVHVGLRVIETKQPSVWRIAQVWRADREVLLIARDTGERRRICWADLSDNYAMVQPFTGVPR